MHISLSLCIFVMLDFYPHFPHDHTFSNMCKNINHNCPDDKLVYALLSARCLFKYFCNTSTVAAFIRFIPVPNIPKMCYMMIDCHDDVIKWKHFPRYWPFVREIHRFTSQRPVTRSFDVFFDRRLNKWLSKQSTLVIWDAIALVRTSP